MQYWGLSIVFATFIIMVCGSVKTNSQDDEPDQIQKVALLRSIEADEEQEP